ncbi:MAG TPA: alpha-hydroxy-acid oxidizing protein, partial [Thermoplasmata archaeon]|nr:alpha-hydroxy-acid oxidizing protein [Thermoplasmata archaeon]
RGADILVALALGARAVGLGRPVLWALAAEGEVGVARYLELLRADLVSALVLSGRADLAAIDRELLGEPPRPRAVRGSGRRPGSRSRPSSPRRSRGHRYGPSRLRPSNSP